MKILAFHSPMSGMGKSTICNYIRLSFSQAKEQRSFAESIREMLVPLLISFEYTPDFAKELIFEDRHKNTVIPELKVTPRYLLRTLGTDWGRELVSSSMWIDIMLRKIEAARKKGVQLFLIDDLRFKNEFIALRNIDATLIKIIRDTDETTNHASEGLLNDESFDDELENNFPVKHLLHNEIDKRMPRWLEKV